MNVDPLILSLLFMKGLSYEINKNNYMLHDGLVYIIKLRAC